MKTLRAALFAFVTSALVVSAVHAEQIDNPQYVSWSKEKPGTSVTIKMDIGMTGMNMSQQMTQTLAEVTADKVILDVNVQMDMGGMKRDNKQKSEIPAKIEKGKEQLPNDMKGTTKETTNETVEVAGKKYDCKIMEFSGEGARGKASGKVWRSMEIPGGMAKTQMNLEAPMAGTINMVVTDIQRK